METTNPIKVKVNNMNYKQFNHKLKELKNAIDTAKAKFFVSTKYSTQEMNALHELDLAQNKLEQFRNTKLNTLVKG